MKLRPPCGPGQDVQNCDDDVGVNDCALESVCGGVCSSCMATSPGTRVYQCLVGRKDDGATCTGADECVALSGVGACENDS